MYSKQRKQKSSNRARAIILVSAVFGVAMGLGGCSTDVSRFDLGKYSYNGSDGPTGSLPPVPSEPMAAEAAPEGRRGENYPRASRSAGSFEQKSSTVARDEVAVRRQRVARSDVRSSQLSDLDFEPRARGAIERTAPRRPTRMIAALPKEETTPSLRADSSSQAGGATITVERGDTLYGLSRRYGVSVRALQRVNGMNSTMIRPGQSLILPGRQDRSASFVNDHSVRPASRPAPRAADIADAGANAANKATETAGTGGDYIVRPGDSFSRIARRHGLVTADLMRANPNVNPRRLRPGQRLRIPGGADYTVAGARAPRSAQTPRVVNVAALRAPSATMTDASPGIRKIEPRNDKQVAAIDATPPRSSARQFRWPVEGKVISKFGPRNDGTHNDGINMSVPMGTSVKAAENGVVAYAGSELKGYGNLILVRHDNNWVTAYAHNSKILVKRGDKIRRGQVIAKVGNTGTVDSPQLHFELRKGSKPVNPLPYLQVARRYVGQRRSADHCQSSVSPEADVSGDTGIDAPVAGLVDVLSTGQPANAPLIPSITN